MSFFWVFPSDNIPINQLFGVSSGLGMGILTFDWTEISFMGSPLMVPWWAEVHIMIGFVATYWIIGPILYYTDVSHRSLRNRNVFLNNYFPILRLVFYVVLFFFSSSGTSRTYRYWVLGHTIVMVRHTMSLECFIPTTRSMYKRIMTIRPYTLRSTTRPRISFRSRCVRVCSFIRRCITGLR